MSETMIQIRALSKSFDDKKVLSDLSLNFPIGRTSVLMGPSGCGKTTLFRILAGLETQDSGEISGLSAPVSLMFQEDRLINDFSARQNIELVIKKTLSKDVLRAHFARIGLDFDDPKPVRDYSGGMRRRVALLRTVLFPTETILFDEPFKGLDEALKEEIIAYLKETLAGKTAIIISHDKEDAELLGAECISWPM